MLIGSIRRGMRQRAATPSTATAASARKTLCAAWSSAPRTNVVARGSVVDQDALVSALTNKTIAGAGLDVYAHEPQVPDALKAMDNVVLLPHLGSATAETRVAMGMKVADNLDAFFAGREPPDRVA